MGPGEDARNLLLGVDIPLKLGYIGVKGRSQKDISDHVKVKQALEKEREYFETHSVYSKLPPGLCGTDALVSKLTKVLYQHIREYLPRIHKEIVVKSKECEERLKGLGNSLPSDNTSKARLLWEKSAEFTEHFKSLVQGRYDGGPFQKTQEITGGAKIKLMFHELYKDLLKNKATAIYEDKDIQRAVDIHQGDSIPGFPSIDSFLCLVHPLLKKLKEPALLLLNDVATHLEVMASELINQTFER